MHTEKNLVPNALLIQLENQGKMNHIRSEVLDCKFSEDEYVLACNVFNDAAEAYFAEGFKLGAKFAKEVFED